MFDSEPLLGVQAGEEIHLMGVKPLFYHASSERNGNG
jgi:hypothetical protein